MAFSMVAARWLAVCVVGVVRAAPARGPEDVVLVPVRQLPPPLVVPSGAAGINQYPMFVPVAPYPTQLRGPFGFIGNWIQQSEWFPVEVNVPDTIGNLGNGFSQFTTNLGNGVAQITQNLGGGFQQFAQNVGSGVQQFAQNVGTGFNQWAQNVGQRIPWLGNLARPQPGGTRFVVVVPEAGAEGGGLEGDREHQQLQHNLLVLEEDFSEAFV